MSWQRRQEWVRWFEHTQLNDVKWFNNVDGILDYFQNSRHFQASPAMMLADAGVLQVIQDGMAAAQMTTDPLQTRKSDHDIAAGAWEDFFRGVIGGQAQPRLIGLWGTAEQAGVTYGTNLIKSSSIRESPWETKLYDQFTDYGNIYRWEATNNVRAFPSPSRYGLVTPDPRSEQDRFDVQWWANLEESGFIGH
jgi:hypothetical protein